MIEEPVKKPTKKPVKEINNDSEDDEEEPMKKPIKKPIKNIDDNEKHKGKLINQNNVLPLIKLKKNEMLQDIDGNVVKIEVRGERQYDKCLFKVYDVSKRFDMKRLRRYYIAKIRIQKIYSL